MIKPREELSNLKPYEIASYPEKWDMKLDSNENYIGPSTKALNALKNIEPEQISHYPCYGFLYGKLSEIYETSTENFVLTNGADEALSSLLNTYISKEDKIITVKPSFSMPQIYSQIIGAEYIEIPYEKKWEFPIDSLCNAVDEKTKAIIITTPNNPTGDVVSEEFILKVLEQFSEKLVIIDETYANFSGYTNASMIQNYSNVAVVRSFSKDYGLAGLRLGYIISDAVNIQNIKKVLSPYNVNVAAIIAAYESLSDTQYLRFAKNEIERSKEFLYDELEKLGITAYKSFANFILADFGEDVHKVYKKLKANGIIVKNYDNSELLKNCLRITVPTLTASKRIISLISPKDTIIFDMDGVMVDVSSSYFEAIKHTYKHYTGKELANEEIQEARKQGGLNNDWDLTHHLIKKSGFNFSYEEIVKVFQKQYWNDGNGSINDETLIIDSELLNNLSKNYNLAVFTGRPKEEAFYTLNKFEIKKYFSKIVTMDDLPIDKQKPDVAGLIEIKNSFITNRLVYLGDTVDDAKCACDYGAYGVGVLPPSDKSEELKEVLLERGAKTVIDNVNNIKNILENF